MSGKLSLALLGKLQISRADVPVDGFVSNKAQALLCYLAVTGRTHYRTALVGLLWGETAEDEAKASLRVALSNLRKLVGEHVTITRQTAAFNLESDYELDVDAFVGGVEDEGFAIESLQQAVALYQGEFLEGFYVRDAPEFEDWVLVERERLRELALQAFERLVDHFAGDHQAGRALAIHYTRQLLTLDPWREEAHRQLMLLQARNGQYSTALAQYQTCRRVLDEELGVEPTPPTTALFNRIRAIAASPRHNLPTPSTLFIGRQRELAELAALLTNPACRLLSIVGPGGIGKTRLALQTAQQQADLGAFLDGVYFIPLVGLTSADYLISTLADHLGFDFYDTTDQQAQVLSYLRETKQETLLVLDNVEHLLNDPAGERQLTSLLVDILSQTHEVKVLVTSRQRLKLQDEWSVTVAGLPIAAEASEAEATQLFVQSARRVQRDFSPSADDQAHIEQICQRVEGLPLGIELAAAWIRVLSCAEIFQEIKQSLDFLESGLRDVTARHQSLRAIFDTSWQLLSDKEQQLLIRLAIFRGGFRREAAEQIAQARLPRLLALVDKSFLRWTPSETGGAYELHETLHQYAFEKLQGDDTLRTTLTNDYCQYYSAFLQQRETALQGGQQKEAVVDIGEAIDNIRLGWQWSLDRRAEAILAGYIHSLFLFYEIRGWYLEGVEQFEQAIKVFTNRAEARNSSLLPCLMSRQGALHRRLSNYGLAEQRLGGALITLQSLGDQPELAFCLNQLGNVAGAQGRYDEAQTHYQASLSIRRDLDDSYGIAVTLNNLGYTAYLIGNYDTAQQYYDESVTLCQALGDQWGLALARNNAGLVAYALGDHTEAKQWFEDSLAICREIGDQFVMGLALNNLGLVAEALQTLDEARQYHEESLALAQESGNRRLVGLSLNNLGAVALVQQSLTTSEQYYQASLSMRQEIGDRLGQAHTLKGLGQVALAGQKHETAERYFVDALQLADAIQATPVLLDVLVSLTKFYHTQQTISEAIVSEVVTLILNHPASEQETQMRAEQLGGVIIDGSADQLSQSETVDWQAKLRVIISKLVGDTTEIILGAATSQHSPTSDESQ